jgi:hypothetical protein
MSLIDSVVQGIADFDLLHDIMHGLPNETVSTAGGKVPTIANVIAGIFDRVLAALSATSTTPVEVSMVGNKTFTIAAGKGFQPGQSVFAHAGGDKFIAGVVASYAGSVLVITPILVHGEGTANSWNIALSGASGMRGLTGDRGKNNYELAVSQGFMGTLPEYLQSLRGPPGNDAEPGTGSGAPKRHYVSFYPWEDVVVVPPEPERVTDVVLDEYTLAAYSNTLLNSALGEKRLKAAQAIINSLGSSLRFVLKRNNVIVLTANYNTPLVLVNQNGEIGLRLGTPVTVVTSDASIDTGVWVAEIAGGANYARSILLSVGPFGSDSHLFLDNDLSMGSTYDATFVIALPQ